MASITSWIRLEPQSRNATMQRGLQARVHDPLWLLARQWQFGEFQAEDAGSPISVRMRGDAARLSRYRPGRLESASSPGQPYDGQTPLETIVEGEPLTRGIELKTHPGRSADAGLHFLRLLDTFAMSRYRADYLARYPFRPSSNTGTDLDGTRYLRVMSGRALDGDRLYAELASSLRPAAGVGGLPAEPLIEANDQTAIQQAASAWLDWFERRYSEAKSAGDAWIPERMEYAFSVGARTAGGEAVFSATEYEGGRLDWFDFNVSAGASLGAGSDPAAAPVVRTVIPAPVGFQGMPDSRWWTFEDADADLGSLEAGPEDLGRMLLLQYAFTYSDDWFVIPVDAAVGSLLQIGSLVVTDTFGVRTRIRPFDEVDTAGGNWRMFTQSIAGASVAAGKGNQIFLPPVLGSSQQGRTVEEVHLLRDEMANLAWAVEHKVENIRGRALDRHELYLAQRPDPADLASPIPAEAALSYRLLTEVPEHWIPLVPTPAPDGAVRLRRGAVLQHRPEGSEALRPLGKLLEPGRDLRLFDEDVPRAGAHVTRAFQLARWTDGSAFLWMGRRKRTGRGEGWSGLRYDVLEPANEDAASASGS